jgi:predicted 2-oxoglutarate/Fe(II)-dependent dioxygenase YbiX
MNKLKDYILVLENIIPHDLCDEILKEYSKTNEWENSLINEGVVNKKIRNCLALPISSEEIINKNKNIRKKIDNDIFECVSNSIKIYNKKFKYAYISKDSGYDLLKYSKGDFYIEHIDSYLENPRTISCSLILNNDFKGGEFSFFNNGITYSLKKGSAILFPSNFMFPHSVLPVTQGVRYSIVTWLI